MTQASVEFTTNGAVQQVSTDGAGGPTDKPSSAPQRQQESAECARLRALLARGCAAAVAAPTAAPAATFPAPGVAWE